MTTSHILAQVPAPLMQMMKDDLAERVGMVVRDKATKKILGHLQETPVAQTLIEKGLGLASGGAVNPLGALTGAATMYQNHQMGRQLDVLQTMMGGVQALQVAAVATSIAGLGVSVVGTAMVLSRIKAVDARLVALAEKMDAQDNKREDWDVHGILLGIESSLERLAEANFSKRSEPIVETEQRTLHEHFGQLSGRTQKIVQRKTLDSEMLGQLLTALSICGNAQLHALIWMDDKERAGQRAVAQAKHLEALAMLLPQDILTERLAGNAVAAQSFDALSFEVRTRFATMPFLTETLLKQDIHGRTYLEMAKSEGQEPLLLLEAIH